ncbi:MAG: PilZ domain-containing protein [Bdellovibrionota bacterium]|nr:PilZ domain-containing protein [Deltaproteobacteria bacterium]
MKSATSKPRYTVNLPIKISGKSEIRGTLLDISKTGAKIKLESKQTRCIDSYLSFYIFLDGHLPSLNYNGSLSIGRSAQTFEDENRIKVVSKIVRYAGEDKGSCWGLEILQPEGIEKVKFHRLLADLEQKSTEEIAAIQGQALSRKGIGFTIKFKQMRNLVDFLPDDLYGSFFIPTNKPRKVGHKTTLVLVHPVDQTTLEFTVRIESFGYPIGSNRMGATCSFVSITEKMIKSINDFTKLDLY